MVSASIPNNTIVNADDLGSNKAVNAAILKCFERGIINSSSLLTNMPGFDEAINLIRANPCMQNIGVHVNLAEGEPLIFRDVNFLDESRNWDLTKINRLTQILTKRQKSDFLREIRAQITEAVNTGILFTHIDSHYHIHTLPAFFPLFLQVAQEFNLKLRLAQTYSEGNYVKYLYRKFINSRIKHRGLNYSDYFETVSEYLKNRSFARSSSVTEVMIHPDLNDETITDHTDKQAMQLWVEYLQPQI